MRHVPSKYIWFVFMHLAIFRVFSGLDKKFVISQKTALLHRFSLTDRKLVSDELDGRIFGIPIPL